MIYKWYICIPANINSFPSDLEIDDEVSSEEKVNSVYDSPSFKNTLAISKGKPRKGFKVEDLPEENIFNCSKETRCVSFKIQVCKPQHMSEDFAFKIKGRTREEIRAQSEYKGRKSSTEILLGLQNKLHESKLKTSGWDGKKLNTRKMVIIEDY